MRRRGRSCVLTSIRTAARNFDLLLAIATPSTSVPSVGPSGAAMSVKSMMCFRIRSNWQQRRREDLKKHPGGEEEKEHFVPR